MRHYDLDSAWYEHPYLRPDGSLRTLDECDAVAERQGSGRPVRQCHAGRKPPVSDRESSVQAAIRLRAAELGWWLLRNNVGAYKDAKGRLVRYGLANSSPQEHDMYHSSDLIGIGPMGLALAVECKPRGWTYDPSDDHEAAQERFLARVRKAGGIGIFCTDARQLERLVWEQVWTLNGGAS